MAEERLRDANIERTNTLINHWLQETRGLPITLQLTKLGFAVIAALDETYQSGFKAGFKAGGEEERESGVSEH